MVIGAGISCRRARVDDAGLLAACHRKMFEEMREAAPGATPRDTCCGPASVSPGLRLPMAGHGQPPDADFDRLEKTMAEKLIRQLADGTCAAWIAVHDRQPVGTGAVTFITTVPVPEDPNPEIGFLHSVFTEKTARNQGIASAILDLLLAHCRQRGIRRVQLNASRAGQRLYETKGFQSLDQVMLCWL